MKSKSDLKLAVVGSVGVDIIETPRERRVDILGGSAAFACAAASFFCPTGMVGVVGTDFPDEFTGCFRKFGIDLAGLQVAPGKTFKWSAVYEENMDNRRTLSTELNVFEAFRPELPDVYRDAPFLFLANISPSLQLNVLDQVRDPVFILADTMNLWINIAREDLRRLIGRVHMLTLNESEARLLTGRHNLVSAAREILAMGPKHVLVKKGEHGSLLFSGDEIFVTPAFPLEEVVDPTGAGDTFAGGFMGALALRDPSDPMSIRQAMHYGSVLASFTVEAFSLDKLREIDRNQIEDRLARFRRMLKFE